MSEISLPLLRPVTFMPVAGAVRRKRGKLLQAIQVPAFTLGIMAVEPETLIARPGFRVMETDPSG